MRKSIVFKWFLLTAFLFFSIFVLIALMQSYFFEKAYIQEKIKTLDSYMQQYPSYVEEIGLEAASMQFYKDKQIWIAGLDDYGQIANVENYYIEVQLINPFSYTIKIPMYSFESIYSTDVLNLLSTGDDIVIDAIFMGDYLLPYNIQAGSNAILNRNIAFKLHGPEADMAYSSLEYGIAKGAITRIVFPDDVRNIPFPYQEQFFLNQIKEFQARLLLNPDAFSDQQLIDVSENLVEYRVMVIPANKGSGFQYIFAMVSLQPVNEAMSIMQQFFPYFIVFAFVCVAIIALFFVQWLAKPLKLLNDTAAKMAGRDFTEKLPVKSDDEIGQLSKNINYLSSQMESYINSLKNDLEKEHKLENTRKAFIAGVSHELKTPLTIIKTCISAIRDGIAIDKTERYLDAVDTEIKRMDLLIGNMLDLAKFESGTYKPEMEIFEADELIHEIYTSFSQQINEKKLMVSLNLIQLKVKGHRGLISRVIANFLSNAIRHTESSERIAISMEQTGCNAYIYIKNQGATIPDEYLDKIWNRFYRLDSEQYEERTGLGLAISKEILELHQSKYGAVNTKDGVCFYFSLPVQP